MIKPRARRRAALRGHYGEYLMDMAWRHDAGISAARARCSWVSMVEEVDIHTVSVVGGADGRDGRKSFFCFSPAPSTHASAIIYEEDGVELREKCILGVTHGAHRALGCGLCYGGIGRRRVEICCVWRGESALSKIASAVVSMS